MIERLLAIGNISDEARFRAFTLAASNGNIDLFERILFLGSIPRYETITALRFAGSNGHVEIIKRLLNLGAISQDALQMTFQISVEKNRFELVDLLLTKELVSKEFATPAMRFAVEKNFDRIFDSLLRFVPTFEMDRDSFVLLAAEKGSISKEPRSAVLWATSLKGFREIAIMLMANGAISLRIWKMALDCAGRKNHLKIVKILQRNKPVD